MASWDCVDKIVRTIMEPLRHGDIYLIKVGDVDTVISNILQAYYDSDEFVEDAMMYCRDAGWGEPA